MKTKTIAPFGVALGLVLSFCLAAASAGDDKTKVEGDLKRLQGEWIAAGEIGGGANYTFEGNRLKVVGSKRRYDVEVVLDELGKPEKTIDLKVLDGPDDAKGRTSKGVYKFEGEKFIYCFATAGERPGKFETKGYEQMIVTLSRRKPKAGE